MADRLGSREAVQLRAGLGVQLHDAVRPVHRDGEEPIGATARFRLAPVVLELFDDRVRVRRQVDELVLTERVRELPLLASVAHAVAVGVEEDDPALQRRLARVPDAVAIQIVPLVAVDLAVRGVDRDLVVLDLAVGGSAVKGQVSSGAEAEPRVSQDARAGRARHGELEVVRAGHQGLVHEDLIARLHPRPVVVEVDPSVQRPPYRRGHVHGGQGPRHQTRRERDAVLVVRGRPGQVVASRVGRGLSVGLSVDLVAEIHTRDHDVSCAVVGAEGRVAPTRVRCVAPVVLLSRTSVADEDVVDTVVVRGHDVEGRGLEGHTGRIGAHGEGRALAVDLVPVDIDARAEGLVPGAIANEDVAEALGVARDEIGRARLEGHVLAVATDRGLVPARPVRLGRAGADAHSLRRAGNRGAHKDVAHPVCVAGHQAERVRHEGDVRAVGVDGGALADAIALHLVRVDADARGGASGQVAQEHVPHAVRVARHQVRRVGVERHVLPVAVDGGPLARFVPFGLAGVHAHAGGDLGLGVVDEDVSGEVAVAGDQVIGVRCERDVASVGANGWAPAIAVGLRLAVGLHGDARGGARVAVVQEDVPHGVGVACHQIGRD